MTAVMEYQQMPPTLAAEAWKVYRSAMEPKRAEAMQRHMLTREEFEALCDNRRITKLIAFDDRDLIVGVTMITSDLEAYDWIEPLYFAARWPDEFYRGAIFYVLFVTAAPDAPLGAFALMVQEIVARIETVKGIGALDFSSAREAGGLARASKLIIGRAGPLKVDEVSDTQHFHVYQFNW
jgi:hypothetical protein